MATPSSPTGVSKMTAATRERKRAKDREAQRVSRERTKAYITHLETVVAELWQSSQKELGSTVEEQFKQQRREIEKLQRTVHKIARLAASVGNPQLAAKAGGARGKAAAEGEDVMEEDEGLEARTSPERDLGAQPRRREESTTSHSNTSNKQTSPASPDPPSPSDSDAWKEKILHGISPTDPGATSFLSSFMPQTTTTPNMFAALNSVITALQFCHGTKPVLSEAQDDDICIRAVVFGWETVEERELDVVWRAVRTIDRRLYARCRVVERVGMLRILRGMLVKIVYTGAKTRSTIPTYMNPTHLQTTKSHAPIVDCLIWPSLRDLMLAIDCTYSSQDSCLQYCEVLRFDWPHDARDLYKISYVPKPSPTSTSSNLGAHAPPTPPTPAPSESAGPGMTKVYSFTHEYEVRYAALGSWSLKPGSKCLFQRPRLNLNYCDLFGLGSSRPAQHGDDDDAAGDGHSKMSECCFLCEADVATLGGGGRKGEQEHQHRHGHLETVEGRGSGLGGLLDAQSLRGSSVIDRGYEAALGAVYPNILLDM